MFGGYGRCAVNFFSKKMLADGYSFTEARYRQTSFIVSRRGARAMSVNILPREKEAG